jgi:thioester reductase-like protein
MFNMSEKIILITGFPGFVGTRLFDILIADKNTTKIYALVLDSFYQRALKLVKTYKNHEEKIELLIGDISKSNLGLDIEKLNALTQQITEIFHLAAMYDYKTPKKIAWKVNVIGTHNMIKFGLKCQNLRVFVYYSSIVATGKIKEEIFEDKLDTNCTFHFNYYEQTKFAAEVLIRRYLDQLPVIIIRPAPIMGESKTGFTDKFDGVYYFFRYIPLLKLLPLRITDTTFHIPLVPVDYLAEATYSISNKKECIGHCFHIGEFDQNINQYIAALCSKDEYGLKIPLPQKLLDFVFKLPIFSHIFKNKLIRFIFSKVFWIPAEVLETFDAFSYLVYRTDNSKYLDKKCPKFKDYAPNLIKFYKENKKNPKLSRR